MAQKDRFRSPVDGLNIPLLSFHSSGPASAAMIRARTARAGAASPHEKCADISASCPSTCAWSTESNKWWPLFMIESVKPAGKNVCLFRPYMFVPSLS